MIKQAPPDQIEAAKSYEALMVPALFGEWASKVADAAAIKPGQRVLDVACGTGVLTREIASRTGSNGKVTGLDPNAGMLEVARQITPDMEWHQGLAESLPFPDQSFDAVVSQFGLMFFSDRQEALRQVLRVLKHRGRFVFAVWDSLDNNPAYRDEAALLEYLASDSAADAIRVPYLLGSKADLMKLFQEAGVVDVEVTTSTGTARFPSLRVMVEADLRGWLPVMGIILSEEEIANILKEADHSLSRYVASDGTVSFTTSAHIITGLKSGI
jgi:SAM-dependent methyltransferase